ncbi:hypothetical protein HK097_001385 [Rhizophlyctis rosea]|uniref:Cytidine deaminase n=1 Tax=Rhizophlyctis rosea TaxID=64517 RepID=A0AAD5WYY5_9FUNG|nr:hypothetical protein HK097_001385 [Rhizophlyctis rosea]
MSAENIPSDELAQALETGSLPPQTVKLLHHHAATAKQNSYSPYSKFRVGASLLTHTGEIFTGCNVENASYGGAICAERTAFVKAVSEGHKKFLAVVVATDVEDAFISPCGFCRQFMVEFGKELLVYMTKADGSHSVQKLKELLPHSFGPEDLEKPR